MVAKRRQSHPKATAKPDAPARTTAGHPKAVHKVPKTSVGTVRNIHAPWSAKNPVRKIRPPRSVRKRPKKRFPRTEGMPITHQRKGAFRTIFTPAKHPRKKKKRRPKAGADPSKKRRIHTKRTPQNSENNLRRRNIIFIYSPVEKSVKFVY